MGNNVFNGKEYSFEEIPYLLKIFIQKEYVKEILPSMINQSKEKYLKENSLDENTKLKEKYIPTSSDDKAGDIYSESLIKANKILEEAKTKAVDIIEDAKVTAKDNLEKSVEKAETFLDEAKQKNDKILKENIEKSEEFLRETEKQSNEIREKAYVNGYQDGLEKGKEEGVSMGKVQGYEEWQRIIEKWEYLIQQVIIDKKELMKKAGPSLLNLSVAIAEKILAISLPLDRLIVIRQMEVALKEVLDKEWIKIRIHPDDYGVVKERKAAILENSLAKNIYILEDPTVPTGGCIIETPSGNVDARLKTQLEVINQNLNGL